MSASEKIAFYPHLYHLLFDYITYLLYRTPTTLKAADRKTIGPDVDHKSFLYKPFLARRNKSNLTAAFDTFILKLP